MTPDTPDPSRRGFLTTLGLAALGSSAAQPASAAIDSPPAAPLQPTGADLGSLWPTVQKLAESNRYSDSFLAGRFATFPEFQAAARATLLQLLHDRPAPVDPSPEVLERVDCGEYTREKILFSTSSILRVPAYVLIPKNLKGPAPAIVDLHSHGGMFLFGKEKVVDLGIDNHPAMVPYHLENYEGRPTATALVRRGYVVITIDAFLFGERRILMDRDLEAGWNRAKYSMETVRQLNQVCRSKESTLVKALILAGMTWPGIVFWDDIRTVDYLVSRPEVDPKRLGCVGVSMGGYRSLFLAALDPRIRAACVTGFMSTVGPMIRAHLDTHSWIHFLPELHRHLDWPDVAALAAPRSLLVQQCSKDGLFPLSGMKESVETLSTLFDRAGVPERFTGRFYDTPHQFNRAMQDDAFAWLDRELA
jgi:dienelactone hydrolase